MGTRMQLNVKLLIALEIQLLTYFIYLLTYLFTHLLAWFPFYVGLGPDFQKILGQT